jgi:hypothetical protein
LIRCGLNYLKSTTFALQVIFIGNIIAFGNLNVSGLGTNEYLFFCTVTHEYLQVGTGFYSIYLIKLLKYYIKNYRNSTLSLVFSIE